MAMILVRTRPLGYGNYGGLLQAYALQRALEALGHEVRTDRTTGAAPTLRARATQLAKRALISTRARGLARPRWIEDHLKPARDSELHRFIDERIHTVDVFNRRGQVNRDTLDAFDAFVVGSDQVWRAAYGRVPSYLFDFLEADDPRPRVAYAASFGTDNLDEYTPALRERTRLLAQRFEQVSVRERSGIRLAREAWGVTARHVIDPTMLLDARHYRWLSRTAAPFRETGGIVSYILDPDPTTSRLVARIAHETGLTATPLLPPTPTTLRQYEQNRESYARPSVEQWLRGISEAAHLVTDSFHGTVFAALFNVPFTTIANRARGPARLESLLETLGMRDRLIDPTAMTAEARTIAWDDVNSRIEAERRRSLDFLRVSLQVAGAESDEDGSA